MTDILEYYIQTTSDTWMLSSTDLTSPCIGIRRKEKYRVYCAHLVDTWTCSLLQIVYTWACNCNSVVLLHDFSLMSPFVRSIVGLTNLEKLLRLKDREMTSCRVSPDTSKIFRSTRLTQTDVERIWDAERKNSDAVASFKTRIIICIISYNRLLMYVPIHLVTYGTLQYLWHNIRRKLSWMKN